MKEYELPAIRFFAPGGGVSGGQVCFLAASSPPFRAEYSRSENKERAKTFRDLLSPASRYLNRVDYPITGENKWVVRRGFEWPGNLIKAGLYAYVLMPDGELRIAANSRPQGKIHHPELTHSKGIKNPKEVIGAGMMKIEEGQVTCISNESGHYCPDVDSLFYVQTALEFWGIPLKNPLQKEDKWALIVAD
ncbi:MAG: hypothetical protein Q8P89_03185 [bacterium]|nr:hypothetical protein [bacterium]